MGVIATHALIQAQLIIKNINYGLHPFVVQIRSLSDHSLLKGIEACGDVGSKLGFNTVDNGFIRFNNLRVDRNSLLMKYAKVDSNGTYSPPPHPKLSYGGMVLIRAKLVSEAATALAKATTIAVRYCSIRRQFGGDIEKPVISYGSVQYRLFPLIAASFAINSVGIRMNRLFLHFQNCLQQGKTELLSCVHAISSGLKAYVTGIAANGIEEARKACGGHGYSAYAGFSRAYADYVATNTYEGDNHLLTQQLVKYLLKFSTSTNAITLKSMDKIGMLEEIQNVSNYTENISTKPLYSTFDLNEILLLLEANANVQLKHVGEVKDWKDSNIECYNAFEGFCQYFCYSSFLKRIFTNEDISTAVRNELNDLAQLYGLTLLKNIKGPFNIDRSLLIQRMKTILKRISLKALHFMDAWDFSDYELDSAIGKKDGRVYEELYRKAVENPINTAGEPIGYWSYVKPMMMASQCSKY